MDIDELLENCKTLDQLWNVCSTLNKLHYPSSTLIPIMGGGKLHKPKFMFVFINPTYKNLSSREDWKGARRPWTGTKYIWKIFSDAGLFSKELLKGIQSKKDWDVAFADKVYQHLTDSNFYFTNIVKWTGNNSDLPDSSMIKTFLPLLKKEIDIVRPEYIVTFGLIPFKALTGISIKLSNYYDDTVLSTELKQFITSDKYKIIPCYFPVGRGNPKRATKLLSLLHNLP